MVAVVEFDEQFFFFTSHEADILLILPLKTYLENSETAGKLPDFNLLEVE